MKKIIISFFAIVFSIFLSSCEDETYCYINQAAKDWGVYKEGSWWIYMEELTGVIDSVYIESYNEKLVEEISDKKSIFREVISIQYFRTNDSTIVTEQIAPLSCFGGAIYLKIQNDNKSQLYSSRLLFFNPDLIEEISADPSSEVVNVYDSIKVGDIYYKDVIHVRCFTENQVVGNNYDLVNEYWISKNNWIIKEVIQTENETVTWNLTNSHVIK